MPKPSRSPRPGEAARGATLYTTLEPCAHASERGPTCAALIAAAGIARVVIGARGSRPAHRRAGHRHAPRGGDRRSTSARQRRRARDSLSGYLTRLAAGRPRITLKLALSIDGKIALPSGESKWITGEDARAHVHLERAHSDMILVGRGTYLADSPSLDVRLPGLEDVVAAPRLADPRRSGRRLGNPVFARRTCSGFMTSTTCWSRAGRATATAFLAADLVDRILIYRAPILVGEGKSSFGYIGLDAIADAHGRWRAARRRAALASTGSKSTSASPTGELTCSPASSPTSAPSAAPSSAATCA